MVAKQVSLISNCFTTSPDGWVGAGEIKIKANSALKLSLSWGLASAELGNIGVTMFDILYKHLKKNSRNSSLKLQTPNSSSSAPIPYLLKLVYLSHHQFHNLLHHYLPQIVCPLYQHYHTILPRHLTSD